MPLIIFEEGPGQRFVRSARLVRVYGRCGSGLTHGMADPKHWMAGAGMVFVGVSVGAWSISSLDAVGIPWRIVYYQNGVCYYIPKGEISVAQFPNYKPSRCWDWCSATHELLEGFEHRKQITSLLLILQKFFSKL